MNGLVLFSALKNQLLGLGNGSKHALALTMTPEILPEVWEGKFFSLCTGDRTLSLWQVSHVTKKWRGMLYNLSHLDACNSLTLSKQFELSINHYLQSII